MKRHPALIPISREHHQLLLLAQLLKKDAPLYKGLPDSREGKVEYAKELFKTLLKLHLERDQKVLFPYLSRWKPTAELVEKLSLHNQELLRTFFSLENSASKDFLDDLGHSLERYVRTKERQLFELAQQLLEEGHFSELTQKIEEAQ